MKLVEVKIKVSSGRVRLIGTIEQYKPDKTVEVYFEYPSGEDLYLRAKEDIKGITEEGLSVRDRLAKLPVLLAAKILKDRGYTLSC